MLNRRVEMACTQHGDFGIGDNIKILPSDPKFPQRFGTIKRFVRHGGKGRIYAVVELVETKRECTVPIGACRLLD